MLTLDHHSCHAASAFFLSPFEKALILTLDGEGDGTAGMVASAKETRLVQKTIPFRNSVGWIYSRITDLLGFIPSKEEHKTQWLGLEGEPLYKDVFLRMLRRPGDVMPRVNFRFFRRDVTGVFEPSKYLFYQIDVPGGKSEFTPDLKRNLAASLQAAVTELISDLLASFQKKTGSDRSASVAGCFTTRCWLRLWSASSEWEPFSFHPLPAMPALRSGRGGVDLAPADGQAAQPGG